MHKYLEEKGIKPFFRNKKDFLKRKKFWKQKLTYGFDMRETYDLDYTFYCWLYERLKMYLKEASHVVDLDYHRFFWEGKEYTQRELINEMINRLDLYFKLEGTWDIASNEEQKYIDKIPEIWALVCKAMWW